VEAQILQYPLVMSERLRNPAMLTPDDRARGVIWHGEMKPMKSGECIYCRFISAEAGFRAFALDLQRRATLSGMMTVNVAYRSYAPSTLSIHKELTARRCGVSLNGRIDPKKAEDGIPLIWSLAQHVMLGSMWNFEDAERGWRQAWRHH
jgi:hypothetical protein